MVTFTGIAAVVSSLQRFLELQFETLPPVAASDTTVVLSRTEDLDAEEDPLITPPCLSLFLYRVDVNRTTRAGWADRGQYEGRGLLPLDLHFLFIPWGENADQEYRILGRTVQALDETPILSGPYLDPVTDWRDGESIQVCIEELSTEDVMRTFDSLPIDYKLCLPYLARILVLESPVARPAPDSARADARLRATVAT